MRSLQFLIVSNVMTKLFPSYDKRKHCALDLCCLTLCLKMLKPSLPLAFLAGLSLPFMFGGYLGGEDEYSGGSRGLIKKKG